MEIITHFIKLYPLGYKKTENYINCTLKGMFFSIL